MIRIATTATFSVLLLSSMPCDARTWFVSTSGTGDAPTIQAAADSSSPGDTVLVGPGTFHEQVDLSAPVTLRGMAGAAATTIDGGSDYGNCVESRNLDGVLIESLRFVGATATGYGFTGYGVYAEGGVTVRDCIFENGGPSGGFGAVNVYGDLTLRDSQVRFGEGVLFGGSSLLVEGCLFEDGRYSWNFLSYVKITWSVTLTSETLATISGNVFRDNSGSPVIGWDRADEQGASLTLLVEGNLFVGNEGPALAFRPRPPSTHALTRGGTASIIVRNNTIARHTGYTIGWNDPPFLAEHVLVLERNAITGNHLGPYFESPLPQLTISCNDVWANGVNWTGIPDPTGVDGNISLEPKYCDAEHGNFTVATNSPLRASNNSCQVQIGAFGVGCGPIAVEPASWGQIKAAYR